MVCPVNRRCSQCHDVFEGSDCINIGEVCPNCSGGFMIGNYDMILSSNGNKSLIQKALEFATEKHEGQKRKNGEDYIEHPKRVANRALILYGFDIELYCIAMLHDTLEDTNTTKEELAKKFDTKIADAVKELSRRKDETYFDFIMRIDSTEAIKVKIADLEDNMSGLEESSMKDKYRFAHYFLKRKLELGYHLSDNKGEAFFNDIGD